MLKYIWYIIILIFVIILIPIIFILGDILIEDKDIPFVNSTNFPCSALQKEVVPKNHNRSITINTKPNINIIYWASEELLNNKIYEADDAYKNFSNYGIVKSDENGKAILKFRNPVRYHVKFKGLQKSHIHYRICENGYNLSKIITLYL